jgi:hypothetical protein
MLRSSQLLIQNFQSYQSQPVHASVQSIIDSTFSILPILTHPCFGWVNYWFNIFNLTNPKPLTKNISAVITRAVSPTVDAYVRACAFTSTVLNCVLCETSRCCCRHASSSCWRLQWSRS